jgi:hypothetical protein
MLVLDMIEILPPMGKYKYDTRRILSVKCYIDNSMHLRSCIRNIKTNLNVEVVSNGRPCPKLGEVSFHGPRMNCPWA